MPCHDMTQTPLFFWFSKYPQNKLENNKNKPDYSNVLTFSVVVCHLAEAAKQFKYSIYSQGRDNKEERYLS